MSEKPSKDETGEKKDESDVGREEAAAPHVLPGDTVTPATERPDDDEEEGEITANPANTPTMMPGLPDKYKTKDQRREKLQKEVRKSLDEDQYKGFEIFEGADYPETTKFLGGISPRSWDLCLTAAVFEQKPLWRNKRLELRSNLREKRRKEQNEATTTRESDTKRRKKDGGGDGGGVPGTPSAQPA